MATPGGEVDVGAVVDTAPRIDSELVRLSAPSRGRQVRQPALGAHQVEQPLRVVRARREHHVIGGDRDAGAAAATAAAMGPHCVPTLGERPDVVHGRAQRRCARRPARPGRGSSWSACSWRRAGIRSCSRRTAVQPVRVGPDSAEVRVGHRDTGLPEVHPDRGQAERCRPHPSRRPPGASPRRWGSASGSACTPSIRLAWS